jgi:hypothetical protein
MNGSARAYLRGLACAQILTTLLASGCAPGSRPPPSSDRSAPDAIRWRRVHHETFDAPFADPPWVEDSYGDASPYHVDAYSEDGAFFLERGGAAFAANLARFRSFRRSSRYGEGGWLTVELYGRDSDRDGVPETGGQFVSENGVARLISTRHYDAAIIRSTEPLPLRYRVEVTVGNIRFGGARDGQWTHDGKVNGYDGDEIADPWFFRDGDPTPRSATTQNGVYFLCITDYPRPAPHNNVFIHHHRKVVMDTDNNESGVEPGAATRGPWSMVWNPGTRRGEPDGSHYVSMLWLDGQSFGHDWFGNDFVSYTPGGWQTDAPVFTDKYLDGERYRFTIERDGERYTMSVTGRFFHGGVTTYRASRRFRDVPVTWHYNQTPGEYVPADHDEVRRYGSAEFHTWPAGSAYPDYFFFGDPHINFYEGTAEFDDLDLYLPEVGPP